MQIEFPSICIFFQITDVDSDSCHHILLFFKYEGQEMTLIFPEGPGR